MTEKDAQDTQPELRLEWWEPNKLMPNPLNWRRHPTHQKQSFAGVISQVGWAGAALYNEQTGHLIDGHLRRDWAIEASERVPVLVGSWTLEQEKLILATLDPLAGLAETDNAILAELLRGVQADDANVVAMLAKLGDPLGKEVDVNELWKGMPEFENPEAFGAVSTLKVHFASERDIAEFAKLIGQTVTVDTVFIWYPKQERENLKACIAHES